MHVRLWASEVWFAWKWQEVLLLLLTTAWCGQALWCGLPQGCCAWNSAHMIMFCGLNFGPMECGMWCNHTSESSKPSPDTYFLIKNKIHPNVCGQSWDDQQIPLTGLTAQICTFFKILNRHMLRHHLSYYSDLLKIRARYSSADFLWSCDMVIDKIQM
jgi:hypothetical protein